MPRYAYAAWTAFVAAGPTRDDLHDRVKQHRNRHLGHKEPLSGSNHFSAPPAPDQPVVLLRGVGKHFASGLTALDAVDLEVRRGEFVSVLGPSGCGKTTLMRIIAGLSAPSSGMRRLALDNSTVTASAAGRIGFVFQDPTLMPWRSALGNVLIPFRLIGRVGKAERDRAMAELRAVGLAGFERAYPRQLSGGMQMRVSLARALVTDPELLLLDEPFAALDEITRMALNDDLLRLWAARQATVIFVTHSIFESVYLSTRIAIMAPRPGRIVGNFVVDLPQPRTAALRTDARYAAACSAVSGRLSQAMAARDAAA